MKNRSRARARKKGKKSTSIFFFYPRPEHEHEKVSSNKSHGSLGGWVGGIKLLKHFMMKQLLKPNTETSPANYFNRFVNILGQKA